MNMNVYGMLVTALFLTTSAFAESLTDGRDGKVYRIVKIGKQTWMAENLNFDYNQGNAKSYCYDNKPENCDKYGRLYLRSAAMDSAGTYGKSGVCPEGWRLPEKRDYEILIKTAKTKAGKKGHAEKLLKSVSDWVSAEGKVSNGTNGLGFNALPAGFYFRDEAGRGFFTDEGNFTTFWTSTEYDSHNAYVMGLYVDLDQVDVHYDTKDNGYSIRCVK